jgi:hypothetical protein
MKTLTIIETGYRATIEEQDDPVVWITHAMRGAGAPIDVLLRANAVNYAVKAQGAPPLAFGARTQKHAPRLADDVGGLIAKGAAVFVVDEDLAERGLGEEELITGLTRVRRAELPNLIERFQQVWHW